LALTASEGGVTLARSALRELGGVGLLLASFWLGGCKMDEVIARCENEDLAACELACQRGVVGEGGCLGAGWLALSRGPLERAPAFLAQACAGGDARGCLKQAELVEDDARSPEKAAALPSLSAERQRLLERACQLASQAPAEHVAPWPYPHSRGVLEQACAGWGRTTLGNDESRTRRAFERACSPGAGEPCQLKLDEQLAAARALVPRCKPPRTGMGADPKAAALEGEVDADRMLACKQLATLLDPLRGRALGQSLCVGQKPLVVSGMVVNPCDANSFLKDEAWEHGLRQPERWLGTDPPEW
jgi:hypothetical protein